MKQITERIANYLRHYDLGCDPKALADDITDIIEENQPTISEGEMTKLILKLDIIYVREHSELSELTITKKGLAEAARVSEHYDKKKREAILKKIGQ